MRTKIEELEGLANEVAAVGAKADANTSKLAVAIADGFKGMGSAFTDAIRMIKGGAMPPGGEPPAGGQQPPPKPQGRPGAEPDDDDEPDAPGAPAGAPAPPPKPQPRPQDPGAGFQDMRHGAPANGEIDVTEDLHAIRGALGEIAPMHKAIRRQNKELVEQNRLLSEQNELLKGVLQTQIATTAPLMKGIQALSEGLAAIPTPSLFGGSRPTSTDVARFGGQRPELTGSKFGALAPREQGQAMLKAVQARVIHEEDMRYFSAHGTFDPDESVHKAILAKMDAQVAA